MKRILLYTLTLILIILALAEAYADNQTEKVYAFVKSTKATVYSSTSLNSSAGTLGKFEIVNVIGCDSNIACIEKSGRKGYMRLKDISIVTPLQKSAYVKSATKVYSKPSASAKSIKVAKGVSVNVLAISGSWAMVERNGSVAYIKSSYLISGESANITVRPTATPKPSATPKSTPTAAPTPESKVVTCNIPAQVNVTALPVYASASQTGRKLGTIKSGTAVTVLAYNANWAYIELNGNKGFCLKSGLIAVSSTATPAPVPSPTVVVEEIKNCTPFEAVVLSAKVSVYSGPDAITECLGSINQGTTVTVCGYNSTWAYISLNGRYGYALREHFVKVAATATPEPTPTPTAVPTATPDASPSATVKVYPASTDPIFTDKTTTNQQKAYLFLSLDTDYNQAVACGLVSNFVSESSVNPKSVNSLGYRGICQWSKTRWAILEKWCNENNLDPDSLEGQLKFLRYDLSQRYTVYHKYLLTVENTDQGAYDAGYYFCLKYERPGNTEAASVKRGNNAKNVYWPKFVE